MTRVAAYDVVRANARFRPALEQATSDVLGSGQLILGERLEEFEAAFARYCGVAHCVGTGNGLDALAMALRALGIGPGDEVLVPAFTFIATWLAATQVGAVPVPVDVGQDALIDPARIEAAITPRTRAIVPVHLYGALAGMAAIQAIATRFGLAVVEDAAQAHGAQRDGVRAGAFGIAAAFSFYPSKNLGGLGDGGCVCTNDAALAASVRQARNYGSTHKYEHTSLGQNSRLDELQAAYLTIKLAHLDEGNLHRRGVAETYARRLSDGGLGDMLPRLCPSSAWHQFVVRSPSRRALQASLSGLGVDSSIHYPVAPFDQPCYAGRYDRTLYPEAVRLAGTVLSLPMADYLSGEEAGLVVDAMLRAHGLVPAGGGDCH